MSLRVIFDRMTVTLLSAHIYGSSTLSFLLLYTLAMIQSYGEHKRGKRGKRKKGKGTGKRGKGRKKRGAKEKGKMKGK